MIESTISRESTVSVRLTLSASEKPALLTESVNDFAAPPAVTVSLSNVFVIDSWTSSWTVVFVVLLVLFAPFGSVVPVEVTVAWFARTVPLSTVEASVTCSVYALSAPAARPVNSEHVTSWPAAEQSVDEPPGWNVRPAGSVSLTW